MGWVRQFRLRRAAKQYAGLLGPHLQRAYGASDFYSPVQIRAAVGRLRLDEQFVAIGYAGFLPEDDYATLTPLMPFALDYAEARSLFLRYRPTAMPSVGGDTGLEISDAAPGHSRNGC